MKEALMMMMSFQTHFTIQCQQSTARTTMRDPINVIAIILSIWCECVATIKDQVESEHCSLWWTNIPVVQTADLSC